MSAIDKEDIEFLDQFFEDELSEEGLIILTEKLKNPEFEKYYKQRLDQKYERSFTKKLISYLPLLLMLALLIVGIILILTSTK